MVVTKTVVVCQPDTWISRELEVSRKLKNDRDADEIRQLSESAQLAAAQLTQGSRTIHTPGRSGDALHIRSPPTAQKVRRAISSSPFQSGSEQSSDGAASTRAPHPAMQISTCCRSLRSPRMMILWLGEAQRSRNSSR